MTSFFNNCQIYQLLSDIITGEKTTTNNITEELSSSDFKYFKRTFHVCKRNAKKFF